MRCTRRLRRPRAQPAHHGPGTRAHRRAAARQRRLAPKQQDRSALRPIRGQDGMAGGQLVSEHRRSKPLAQPLRIEQTGAP